MKLSVVLFGSILCFIQFFVMLHVKADVQLLFAERTALMQQQKQLREDLRVVQAEYAHLVSPNRLRAYAKDAGMENMSVNQILPVKASYFWGE